jgi:hypothetical protein
MNKYEQAGYVQSLESKVETLQARVDELEAENKTLRAEISRFKGAPAAREGLTFSDRTGLWSDSAGRLHCPTCLNSDKRNPLKVDPRQQGWRCTAAGHYFPNPDAPQINARPVGDTPWSA